MSSAFNPSGCSTISGMVVPTFYTGEMSAAQIAAPIAPPSSAVGPISRTNHVIAPEKLRAMMVAMAVSDPIKAHQAKVAFEEWLDQTFPTMGDVYMSSPDPEMRGLSIAEAKLVRLGMLNR